MLLTLKLVCWNLLIHLQYFRKPVDKLLNPIFSNLQLIFLNSIWIFCHCFLARLSLTALYGGIFCITSVAKITTGSQLVKFLSSNLRADPLGFLSSMPACVLKLVNSPAFPKSNCSPTECRPPKPSAAVAALHRAFPGVCR